MSRSDLCDLNVVIVATTPRAAKLKTAFRDCKPVWLPLSQIELAANEDGKTHTLTAPEWLLIENGLV